MSTASDLAGGRSLQEPAPELPLPLPRSSLNPHVRLTWALRAIALVLGLLQTWRGRYIIFSDGISYLDIAAAYQRGDWANAINAYWSPLYSWLLAIAHMVLRPTPAWSVPTLHLVNWASFLASLAALEFFIRKLAQLSGQTSVPRSWLVLGYALGLWSGLTRVMIDYISPDILVTAFVFLLSGLLCGIHSKPSSRLFVLLGVALAFAYFTKGMFFVLAVTSFLPASLVSLQRRDVQRSLLAVGVFILACSPFIAALSLQKGRLTFGDTGKLNYGWEVLGAARSTHWQGEPYDIGTPTHPTRKVLASPATYVFPQPVAGTYPPWYDPSYWYDGIKMRISLERQLTVLRLSLVWLLVQVALTPGLLILLVVVLGSVVPRWLAWQAVKSYWFLLGPALAGLMMYCLVFVDRRYVPSFLVVVTLVLWAVIYRHLRAQWILHASVMALAVVTTLAMLARPGVLGVETMGRELAALASGHVRPNPQWTIASRARAAGLQPGEKIAYIGLAISADWTRLNQNRIVGEITVLYDRNRTPARSVFLNEHDLHLFWRGDAAVQARVLNAFRAAGARWVAADYVPAWAYTAGWKELGGYGVDTTFLRRL